MKIPDEWTISTVGEECVIRNDLRMPISIEERKKIEGKYPYYGPTGILGFINEFRVHGKFTLIGEDGDHFLKYKTKSQTLLVNDKFNVNNHAHVIGDSKTCLAEWFYVYFQHKNLEKYLTRQGAGRYKLTKQSLSDIPILLPPIEEQKGITAMLSNWTEAIEKTERLIELKEKQFRNLQKKLIKSYSRSGSNAKLGDVARIPTKQKLENLESKRLLTVKLHCMGIEANDRIKPKLSETGRPYYSRKAGEILIGRQNFHNGGIGIVPENLDGGIASNAITSIEGVPGKLHQKFLYWVLSRENYYQKIGKIMDGTGQKELSENQLLNLSIYLPPYSQQIAISNALDNAKEEFCLIVNIREKLFLQKQALMQKLLTGKCRVNFKEEK